MVMITGVSVFVNSPSNFFRIACKGVISLYVNHFRRTFHAGRGTRRAVGALGCSAAAVAPALFREDDGQPGQEGGGVRQRHRVCEVWICRL